MIKEKLNLKAMKTDQLVKLAGLIIAVLVLVVVLIQNHNRARLLKGAAAQPRRNPDFHLSPNALCGNQ